MPTLSFHSVHLLLIAFMARNRARHDVTTRENALTTDSIDAVVLAAAATEAFINELAEHIDIYRTAASDWAADAISPQMAACAAAVLGLEEARESVEEKFQAAALALSGVRFDAGRRPFQDFRLLSQLRDAIMHVKPARDDQRHAGTRIAEALAQRGLAVKLDEYEMSWFDRLETPAVAAWACASARAIILAVLAMIPDRSSFDPLSLFKTQFRTHAGFSE